MTETKGKTSDEMLVVAIFTLSVIVSIIWMVIMAGVYFLSGGGFPIGEWIATFGPMVAGLLFGAAALRSVHRVKPTVAIMLGILGLFLTAFRPIGLLVF